jgi:NADH-quinone oxidoreductase subunit J
MASGVGASWTMGFTSTSGTCGMAYLFYIAAVVGAAGVYFILPHHRTRPRVGAGLGLAALAGLLATIGLTIGAAPSPAVYYYIFTAISAAAAVRVITHPRPIYSALYFVLVVLSTAGMLLLLMAEFVAFAMVIIYGGAILVTYMFVIMLATQPQSAKEPEAAPEYDRRSRDPLLSVVLGFSLLAVLGSMIFSPGFEADPSADQIARPSAAYGQAALRETAMRMPGKFDMNDRPKAQAMKRALADKGLIADNEYVSQVLITEEAITAQVMVGDPTQGRTRPRLVEIDADVYQQFVGNIDHVGLALFRRHPLGIELAAVILLLSMVGAVVIARRQVPESPDESAPVLPGGPMDPAHGKH